MFAPARYIADFPRFALVRSAPSSRSNLRRLARITLAISALGCAGPLTSAVAATAAQTIAELNAQRSANGLPAGITENAAFSADCAAHDHYMALNHTLTHHETPGRPGYTAGGAYAGQNAVLTKGSGWDHGNPYEAAPLHLDQLLAPRLINLGSADAEGYSCTTTFPGWDTMTPATLTALTVFTYPGNGSTIYAGEVAREQPWTPGDLVGIRQPRRTGPYLIVLVDAPGQSPLDNPAQLSGATLTGPTGPVPVEIADGTTPLAVGSATRLGAYLSPGGFLIPVSPLLAGATYHAHVLVSFGSQQTPHDWSFTTAASDPRSSLTSLGTRLKFDSDSPAVITVSFTRPGGQRAAGVTIRPGRREAVSLSPGSWQACGHQAPAGRFAGYDQCLEIIVTGHPALRFTGHRVLAATIGFHLRFSSVLRGHTAVLRIVPLSIICGAHACTTSAGPPARRTISLGPTLSLPLPARGDGFELTVTTRPFQLADAPWSAARAATRYLR